MNNPGLKTSQTNRAALSALTVSILLLLNIAFAGVSQAQQNTQPGPQKTEPTANAQKQGEPAPGKPADREPQGGNRITREGVAIEMSVTPATADAAAAAPGELIGGDDAVVSFRIKDEATGNPLNGVRPAAWLDRREQRETTGKDCREKIQAFLQGSLAARPTLDLNSYYMLTLNREPTISVIDPLLGYGTTKLLTLIFLNNPGEDWVQSKDGKRIYVTMPASNQVAVIDTVTFKVIANITTGIKPMRIALQNDQKYLWVGCDAVPEANRPSGMSVIDSATNKVVSHIETGPGRHEIVFTSDDRFAFVTNDAAGTVSVIDVSRLALLKTLPIGKRLTSIAYSSLSNSVYVADEASGVVSVVEARLQEKTSSIRLEPGAAIVRFAPSGRTGVVLNPRDNSVSAFDAATNRLMQRFEVEPGPDQVSFTTGYAYIRSFKSDHVTLIPIAALEKGGSAQVVRIPGGQASPEQSGPAGLSGAIVPAPEAGSVLIANPTDKTIYYYTEGMAAPMGSFQNYKREPRGVMIVDRSIRERAPGVYSVNVRLPESGGQYDVPFLLDSPRVIYCFGLNIKPNPEFARKNSSRLPKVSFLIKDLRIPVRETVKFRFKLLDPQSNQPRTDLKDVGVMTMLAPGTWQERKWAEQVEQGIYEISFVPPEHGVYYVFIECPSLRIGLNELPYLILDARRPEQQEPAHKPAPGAADEKKK